MKRDRDDDEKLIKPLFPRVHVRDTDTGWPRAPPRNKMALYERFTVASHRPNHGSTHSGQEPAAKLNPSVPQVIPVPVSREHNVQRSDATSAVSSASRRVLQEPTGVEEGCAVSASDNSVAEFNRCPSDTENCFKFGDGVTGQIAEIASCLDDGIVRGKIGDELSVSDNEAGVSDVSMADSASGPGISPDEVAGAIGQKRFWRAKHAISKQQRLLAKQVFELHRLVKVQRLIAESPHLVLDDGTIKVKSSREVKLIEPGSVAKPRPRHAGFRCDTESAEKTRAGSASLSRGQNCNVPSNPLHHPSSGHHWLIPVMSPSEGLVYKPCPAPPGYGGFGYFCNFTSPPFGFPPPPPTTTTLSQQHGPCSLPVVSHPTLCHFPPYNVPVTHPTTFPGMYMDRRTQCNRTSSGFADQSSCDMSAPQVRTDSVRSESRRVVRAVPCNPRLASESAARIFRSIQEERARD